MQGVRRRGLWRGALFPVRTALNLANLLHQNATSVFLGDLSTYVSLSGHRFRSPGGDTNAMAVVGTPGEIVAFSWAVQTKRSILLLPVGCPKCVTIGAEDQPASRPLPSPHETGQQNIWYLELKILTNSTTWVRLYRTHHRSGSKPYLVALHRTGTLRVMISHLFALS